MPSRDRRRLAPACRVGAIELLLAIAPLVPGHVGCSGSRPPAPTSVRAPARADLAGDWHADLRHNGQAGRFALRLAAGDDGAMTVLVALPDIDAWWFPVGPAEWDGITLTFEGMALEYDSESDVLSGVVPEYVAPVHAIPVELRRAGRLEPPDPVPIDAPVATPAWIFEAGAPVWGGLGAGDDLVLVPDDAGVLHALEARTGEERWRHRTGGAIRARPVIREGTVLVPSDDGHLYWLGEDTGELRRRTRLGEARERLALGERGHRYDHYASAAVPVGGLVYIAHRRDVVALDAATGGERWRFAMADEITTTPAVGDGRVFVGSFDGSVQALDAATGSPLWVHDTGAAVSTSPALFRDRVIVGSRSYDLMALSADRGEPIWNFYYWFSWVESAVTLRDAVAYVGSSDAQMLYAFDAGSGRRRWGFDTGGSPWGQPAVSATTVYIGTVGVADYLVDHRAGVFAVDRETGDPVWRHPGERPDGASHWGFAASPALSAGLVIVGGLDGRILAFPQ